MYQWNQFPTDGRDGMTCEVIDLQGHNGETINAYVARPTGDGPFPSVVLVHHLPGWDEFYREMTRRFAQHGYVSISPNYYAHFGYGTPDDAAARARGEGGVSDETVIADSVAAAKWVKSQSNTTDKVGIIGTCSGGRHTFVVACNSDEFSAAVDCWGGGIIQKPDELTPQRPKSPADMTPDLKIPLLGLFGNDDQNPSAEMVNQFEQVLKDNGKNYEFHRYDGAGHGIFYYQTPLYRPQQAMDCWSKIFDFFERNLGG